MGDVMSNAYDAQMRCKHPSCYSWALNGSDFCKRHTVHPPHEHDLHPITGHCKICGLHAVDLMLGKDPDCCKGETTKPPWQTPTREQKQCPRGGVCGYQPCSFCPDECMIVAHPDDMRSNLKADHGKLRMDLIPPSATITLLEVDPDPKGTKPEQFLLTFMRGGHGGNNSLCMAFAAMAKESNYTTLWGGLVAAAEAFQHGVGKYAEHDWMNGAKWSRYISAALRHLAAIRMGEQTDPESGLEHAAHFLACILILLTYSLLALGDDDRYRPETVAVGNAKPA